MTQDKKILGIDYGDIRIGIAIGFSESKVSSPYSIIENKNNKFVLEELKIILNQEEIEEIVIGIPYSLSSNKEKSDQLKKTKKFIEFLKGSLGIKITEEDERLSTRLAENLTREKRGHKDDIAAQVILQNYLERC
ncbi:Holliday junction resolvase RuvX [Candidatus Falkowbacteria bacterium]|jgi:putative holliday junction resolvase|nr:Holliday junction resolvase RuvX [Candidatus Falkowbacteria bacterium]MBT4433016.1 Holliday junction resolvase RuvX [Candidatus Falkowbacteria bacterium]